jgi:hypothetical protein
MTPALLPNLPASPEAHARYGFEGSQLGEDLAAWRRSQPSAMSCAPSAARVVTCTAPPAALGGGYLAQDLTYQFVDGRLTRIAFTASVDAFSWVRARLDQRFGQPAAVARDDRIVDSVALAHLRDTWRNGRSTIVLDDPTRDAVTLRVTYTLDALAGSLPTGT